MMKVEENLNALALVLYGPFKSLTHEWVSDTESMSSSYSVYNNTSNISANLKDKLKISGFHQNSLINRNGNNLETDEHFEEYVCISVDSASNSFNI